MREDRNRSGRREDPRGEGADTARTEAGRPADISQESIAARSRGGTSIGFHAEALTYLYFFNVLALTVVGRSYLQGLPEDVSPAGWMVTLIAFVANSAILALVPMVVLAPLSLLVRRRWMTLVIVPCLYALLGMLNYADTVVYRLWRFHFNGVVLNLFTTPGAGDSVKVGSVTVLWASAILGLLLAVQLLFALQGFPRLRRLHIASRLRNWKALVAAGLAVTLLIATDKLVYAVADLYDNVELTRSKHLFPLYLPLTIRGFVRHSIGMDFKEDHRPKIRAVKGTMDYPKNPLVFAPGGKRPNILIVTIEGGRYDALDPKTMPFLYGWAGNHLCFQEHYSSGHSSRFGVFGLLYGIHATYWHRVMADRKGSALVDALRDLGYSFGILSCTDLNFPEFRQTAFVEIPEAIMDKWTCSRTERDRVMTDAFVRFLDEGSRPFFACLFYDASHQPYLFPEDHRVFETRLEPEDLNYIKMADDLSLAELPYNRYRNSLHYIDSQIERVIRALEERGLLQDMLVFITGDHGEEFGELGYFGHYVAYERYQAKTVMAVHVPGEKPRQIHRLTSHVDVVPTILTYMGATNPLSDYTQGVPLPSPNGPGYVLMAGWNDAAILDPSFITHFGLEAYNADMTVMDHDYRKVEGQRQAIAERSGVLLEVLNEMKRFVR